MKTCSRCQVEYALSEFYADAKSKGGVRPDCKPCFREKMRNYYAGHREKDLARSRKWFLNNKERAHAHSQAYYQANREKVLERTSQAHAARWRTNKSAEQERHRLWRQANPEKAGDRKRRRRALKKGATIRDLTRRQWDAIKAAYSHRCAYCGKHPYRLTQDHVIPLSLGGDHTAGNIVPACQSCNSRKRIGPPSTYQPMLILPTDTAPPKC